MRAAAPGVTDADGFATLPPPPLVTLVESANGQPPAAAPAHVPDPGRAGGPAASAAAPVAGPGASPDASPGASPAVSPGASPGAGPVGETLALPNNTDGLLDCGTQPSYAAYCGPPGMPWIDPDGLAFRGGADGADAPRFFTGTIAGFFHDAYLFGSKDVDGTRLQLFQGQCQARSRT
jgi:hypothetical protein